MKRNNIKEDGGAKKKKTKENAACSMTLDDDGAEEWLKLIQTLLSITQEHPATTPITFSPEIYQPYHCLSTEDLNIDLVERKVALGAIKSCWTLRQKAFKNGTSDRTKYKLPVCVGLPGVGKTRMLEEYLLIFNEMVINQSIGVLALYYNGHSITEADRKLSIFCSLGWRILHRFLVEKFHRQVNFTRWMKLLEDDEALQQMELSIALRIIRKVLVNNCNLLGKATVISIFLGIDEYQTIPREIAKVFRNTSL